MVHCGRTIAKEEGIKSLWKGLTPFVGQLTLKYALRMGSNAFFLELMRDQVRSIHVSLKTLNR
jgi:solute carrier family 25 citrate transporter 1